MVRSRASRARARALLSVSITGTPHDDTIAVSVGAGGALVVNVNGAVTSYTAAQYAGGISIDTGQASSQDTLTITGLPAVQTGVRNAGLLKATVGSAAHGLADISSTGLTIGGSGGAVQLTLEDSADAASRHMSVGTATSGGTSYDVVHGLTAEDIRAAASPLVINLGNAGNTIDVNGTAPMSPSSAVLNINTGNGADTVNVNGTSLGTVLNINGQNGADNVNVNVATNVQSGVINVGNPLGKSTLTIETGTWTQNAMADTFSSGGQTYGTIQGLGPAAINFNAAQMVSVSALAVGATLTIRNTPGAVPLAFRTGEAIVLGTAPGQSIDIGNTFSGTPESLTVDFSTGRVGAGTHILAQTDQLHVSGASASDAFSLNGGAVIHGDASVTYDYTFLGTLDLAHGTYTGTAAADLSDLQINVNGADTLLRLNARLGSGGLSISNGAHVVLGPGENIFNFGLTLSGGGSIDIGRNELDLPFALGSDPRGTIRDELRQGRITTSAADANHSIGYISVPPDSVLLGGSMIVQYALKGDTNLDGSVNFADLLALAQNYGHANAYWSQGDFNYDGTVNFADLLTLAQTENRLGAAPTAQPAMQSAAATSVDVPGGDTTDLLRRTSLRHARA